MTVEIGLSPVCREGKKGVLATVVDITERRRAQERERLFAGELQHRMQNLFAVIDAVARRSLTDGKRITEARGDLLGRLKALAQSHASLAETDWRSAPLRRIIADETAAFSTRVEVTGCDIDLNPGAVRQFALILHELSTNAAKHGALSVNAGRIRVEGGTHPEDEGLFCLRWEEVGGPAVAEPVRRGFGSAILLEAARQFGSKATLHFNGGGLVYELEVPRAAIEQVTAIGGRTNVA